jgi:hypothetical protein
MRTPWILLLVAACGADPQEPPLPGGPSNADGDADYLTDAEEAAIGTDPASPDTDGDSYLDGDEVLEQSDPTDPESRIYEGRWPYQRFKDDIADPGFEGTPEVGAPVPRFTAVDQYGEVVDLYDFALHDRPVVLDLSAGWCTACYEVAAWLEGEATSLPIPPELEGIPERVASGEIYWVTIYFQDASSSPPDDADVAAWFAEFPNPHVPVLADVDQAMFDWLWPGSYPSIQAVNADMTLRAYDRYDWIPALQSLTE